MLIIAKIIFMCYNCFALGGLNMEFDFNLPVKRIKDNKKVLFQKGKCYIIEMYKNIIDMVSGKNVISEINKN